jgi:hypothetical protein
MMRFAPQKSIPQVIRMAIRGGFSDRQPLD